MKPITKHCLFLIVVSVLLMCANGKLFSQKAIITNMKMPASYIYDSNKYGFGLNIGLDTAFDSNKVFRVSFLCQKQILSNPEIDPNAIQSETSYDYFIKVGFRLAYKRYFMNRKENSFPSGLYVGAFSDIMLANRTLVKRYSSYGVIGSEKELIDNAGIFLAGGVCGGYTFIIGNLVVEPNLGTGLCLIPSFFTSSNKSQMFSGLDSFPIHVSSWHFELNLGWVF